MPLFPDSPQRILIVRPSALGDVCRTVPALVSLRRAFPHAQIDWLVRDSFAPAIAHHPDLSTPILFHRRRWTTWPSLLVELRRRRYDLVFDLQGLARSALFALATAASVRVGFANARELGFLAYTHRYPSDPRAHIVDRMLSLLESHGIPTIPDMRLYLAPDDQRWLDAYLSEHNLAPANPADPTSPGDYAVLAPTAAWRCKRWPIERFIELARRLLDSGLAGRRIIVLAAPHERHDLQPLAQAFSADVSSLDRAHQALLFPTTTVGQMMALISRARLVVCNDSAPLHVAVAFNRPLVAIFGPSDPLTNGPYRRPECVVQPHDAARYNLAHFRHRPNDQSLIAQVTLDMVWQKILQQLHAA